MWLRANRARRRELLALIAAAVLQGAAPAASPSAAAGIRQHDQQGTTIPPQCLLCHDSDLITQQKLSRAAWSRELDKMIKWGAVVPAAERDQLLDRLAGAFGPTRVAPSEQAATPRDAAAAVFTRSCLACHDRDLIAQQRLTRAGWVREVEKMIRWGAPVSESEKSALVDYLASPLPRGGEGQGDGALKGAGAAR
jgi:mono/diheme cytochrome c family protein